MSLFSDGPLGDFSDVCFEKNGKIDTVGHQADSDVDEVEYADEEWLEEEDLGCLQDAFKALGKVKFII